MNINIEKVVSHGIEFYTIEVNGKVQRDCNGQAFLYYQDEVNVNVQKALVKEYFFPNYITDDKKEVTK